MGTPHSRYTADASVVGLPVHARWQSSPAHPPSSRAFPGRITTVKFGYTYDIAFDSGSENFNVPAEYIVEFLKGTITHRGQVLRVNFEYENDPGILLEPDPPDSSEQHNSKWKVGQKVTFQVTGILSTIYPDGFCDVLIDPWDGQQSNKVIIGRSEEERHALSKERSCSNRSLRCSHSFGRADIDMGGKNSSSQHAVESLRVRLDQLLEVAEEVDLNSKPTTPTACAPSASAAVPAAKGRPASASPSRSGKITPADVLSNQPFNRYRGSTIALFGHAVSASSSSSLPAPASATPASSQTAGTGDTSSCTSTAASTPDSCRTVQTAMSTEKRDGVADRTTTVTHSSQQQLSPNLGIAHSYDAYDADTCDIDTAGDREQGISINADATSRYSSYQPGEKSVASRLDNQRGQDPTQEQGQGKVQDVAPKMQVNSKRSILNSSFHRATPRSMRTLLRAVSDLASISRSRSGKSGRIVHPLRHIALGGGGGAGVGAGVEAGVVKQGRPAPTGQSSPSHKRNRGVVPRKQQGPPRQRDNRHTFL